MAKRKYLSKKVRFDVFKRDKFTCQYCGKESPEVVLHVDHIVPVAKGGDNEMVNLVTSCQSCNLGKGARELSDDSAVKKQKAELNQASERLEQIRMLKQWRDEIKSQSDAEVDLFSDTMVEYMSRSLTDEGRKQVRRWLKKYTIKELLDAFDTAFDQYYECGDFETHERTAHIVYTKTPKIAEINKRGYTDEQKRLFYIRGILRNRIYIVEWEAMKILFDMHESGVDIEDIEHLAKQVKSWSQFKNLAGEYMHEEGSC